LNKQNHSTSKEAFPLLQLFNYLHPISKETGDFIIKNTFPIMLDKGQVLHKSGDICSNIYFIKKGAVRGFINDEGKDITTWISIENEVVASIYSFVKQSPSLENMQAIEDCELLRMDQSDLEYLYKTSPVRSSLLSHYSLFITLK
jgi:CRP-like cAMP-binding protein